MKIPKYPEDLYHSTHGVEITESRINKRIKECFKLLRKSKGDFASISSGSNIVIVSENEEEYTIYVSNDYYEYNLSK